MHRRNSEPIMGHDIKTIKQAGALVLQTWRGAAAFFLSIELVLMVVVAFATVGGFWLAVMGDLRWPSVSPAAIWSCARCCT
jgi:hypothetical protein